MEATKGFRRLKATPGTFGLYTHAARLSHTRCAFIGSSAPSPMEPIMHGLIYLIGLIVVVMFILSLFGLR